MGGSYRIETIADMFKVPCDRRTAMLRDLEYSLDVAELAFGEEAGEHFAGMTWTDDGEHSVSLEDSEGTVMLELIVTTEGGHGGG